MADLPTPEPSAALLDAEDGLLLDRLRGVRWPAQRRMRDTIAGAHRSRSLGPGSELSELRAYRQGDETRRIDWKVLARTDRAYIRLAHSHSRISTMVLLDASASMAWPPKTLAKWNHARRLALGLAAVVHQTGDPVGVLAAEGVAPGAPAAGPTANASNLHLLPPHMQAGTVRQIAALLRRVEPRGEVELSTLLARCRYQRLIIVGDFLSGEADAEALLSGAGELCARGREVVALHVVDTDELDPPPALEMLHDSENPALIRHMGAEARTGYQREFALWRETLARQWRQRGAWFATVSTAEPAAHAVRRIVKGPGAGREYGRSA